MSSRHDRIHKYRMIPTSCRSLTPSFCHTHSWSTVNRKAGRTTVENYAAVDPCMRKQGIPGIAGTWRPKLFAKNSPKFTIKQRVRRGARTSENRVVNLSDFFLVECNHRFSPNSSRYDNCSCLKVAEANTLI